MPLAEPLQARLTRFQRLLVLRCLRPDRVLAGIRDFVSAHLGQKFIEPPPFDLAACFRESSPCIPLVFVLSSGEAKGASGCCSGGPPAMWQLHVCAVCQPATRACHPTLATLLRRRGPHGRPAQAR
jgi:hypothetical protein